MPGVKYVDPVVYYNRIPLSGQYTNATNQPMLCEHVQLNPLKPELPIPAICFCPVKFKITPTDYCNIATDMPLIFTRKNQLITQKDVHSNSCSLEKDATSCIGREGTNHFELVSVLCNQREKPHFEST